MPSDRKLHRPEELIVRISSLLNRGKVQEAVNELKKSEKRWKDSGFRIGSQFRASNICDICSEIMDDESLRK